MINLVMPMAGAGSRFSKEGFTLPKPLIELHNEKFFHWGCLSITKYIPIIEIIFVVLQSHVDEFNIDKEIYNQFPRAKIVIIDEILNGASYSAQKAISLIENDYPIVIADCDGMFLSSEFIHFLTNKNNYTDADGGLFTFFATQNNFSYAKINTLGKVEEVAEKKPISNNAICSYYFKNAQTYLKYFKEYIQSPVPNEYYISGIFNIMLKHKCTILPFKTDFVVSYGTPQEYLKAQDSKLFTLMKK